MLTQRPTSLGTLLLAMVFLTGVWVTDAQAAAPAKTPKPADTPAPATKPADTTVDTTPPPSTKDKKVSELWEDLIHYVKIARPDLAKIFAEAILDAKPDPREIYALSIHTPDSQSVLARGQTSKDLKDVIARLKRTIEEGYKAERGDSKQVERAIQMLVEGERAYALGVERLKVSGEFALPQLIQKLTDPKSTSDMKSRIVTVLPQLGREAVRGLSCALQNNDAELQQVLAGALGQLEYPHAVPRLKELLERKDILPKTRGIAKTALLACSGGQGVLDKSAADLFYDLAERYYYRTDSLRPDERFEKANVWYWQEGLGLTFKPVPVQVFYDIYAMRMARLALQHDPKCYQAVSMWLAANIRREIDMGAGAAGEPAGATQPAGAEQLPAKFYVLASSAKYQQDVLTRALRDKDSPMAVKVIEALVETAGAKSLVEPGATGTTPLVEALSFPDRQVRFLAAEALAKALPDKKFSGSSFVMPVLVEALRQTGKKGAVLIAADATQRAALKDAIRAAGYELVEDANPTAAMKLARDAVGVDVFVVGDSPDASDVLAMLRRDPVFSGMPVVVVGQTTRLRDLAAKDGRMVLIDADAKGEAIPQAMTEAINLGTGKPFTPEQAAEWAVRAAEAIRRIGVTNSPVYDASEACRALAAALGHTDPKVQTAAARALAVMSAPEAQRAVAALALKADADEKLRVEAFEAATESARRLGNQLTEEQAKGVVDVVTGKGTEAIKVAAAKLLGSLNLPSEKIKDLIIGASSND